MITHITAAGIHSALVSNPSLNAFAVIRDGIGSIELSTWDAMEKCNDDIIFGRVCHGVHAHTWAGNSSRIWLAVEDGMLVVIRGTEVFNRIAVTQLVIQ
jgi:hypothetical protein